MRKKDLLEKIERLEKELVKQKELVKKFKPREIDFLISEVEILSNTFGITNQISLQKYDPPMITFKGAGYISGDCSGLGKELDKFFVSAILEKLEDVPIVIPSDYERTQNNKNK